MNKHLPLEPRSDVPPIEEPIEEAVPEESPRELSPEAIAQGVRYDPLGFHRQRT